MNLMCSNFPSRCPVAFSCLHSVLLTRRLCNHFFVLFLLKPSKIVLPVICKVALAYLCIAYQYELFYKAKSASAKWQAV